MSKRNAQKAGAVTNERADWTGFANIELNTDDKDRIRGGLLDGDSVLDIMADVLGTGHKVTLSYDRERDVVTCGITGQLKSCRNAGLTMSSFGRDITSVLMVAAYKHEVIAKGDWTPFVAKTREKDDLG